jgi:hypothetical protein
MSDAPAPEGDGTPADTVDVEALKADNEKWKSIARKHEERSKANATAAKELEEFRQSQMSEQEKAVAEATAKARAETLAEVGSELVDSTFKAAAAGRPLDVDALLEGLDRKAFLTDEGKPDADAIGKWIDRIAPKAEAPQEPKAPMFPDLGQGARGKQDMPLNGDPLLRDVKAKLGIQ